MSVTLSLISFLRTQGLSAEQIVEAVEVLERARADERGAYEVNSDNAAERKRAYDRGRMAGKREAERENKSRDCRTTIDDEPSPLKVPPTPPLNTPPSEANASGADAPSPVYTDSKHELWGEGVPILRQLGLSEREARSNIGRWLKAVSDEAQEVLGAIQRARDHRVMDPVPWITRALKAPKEGGNGKQENSLVAAGRQRIADIRALRAEHQSGSGGSSLRSGDANVRMLSQGGRG